MSKNVPPGIHTIRGIMGVCHLLVDKNKEAVLLDTGMIGEQWQMRRLLRWLDLEPESIKAILLTHGHVDHVGNLAWASRFSGAPIYAHRAEQAHIDGRFPYTGPSRWCGRMEHVAYDIINYHPAQIDCFIGEGDELPFWGGLRVMHLPGHTEGHCGFFSERHQLLFSGDLFASYWFRVHLPPPILNSCPELLPESLRRALALKARYIVPQHYDILDGELHRRRFEALCADKLAGRIY